MIANSLPSEHLFYTFFDVYTLSEFFSMICQRVVLGAHLVKSGEPGAAYAVFMKEPFLVARDEDRACRIQETFCIYNPRIFSCQTDLEILLHLKGSNQ